MTQHRPPWNSLVTRVFCGRRVRNPAKENQGKTGQNHAGSKKQPEGLWTAHVPQIPARQGNGQQLGRLRGGLIHRQKPSTNGFRNNGADPRQIPAQGDPPCRIKQKEKKNHENLTGGHIHRQRQPGHQGNGPYHHTSTGPSAKNKGAVANPLHEPRSWNLKNIQQGTQTSQHAEHRSGSSQFLKVEHHGHSHDQIKGTGVKNLKKKGVKQRTPGQPDPASVHAPGSRGRSSGK